MNTQFSDKHLHRSADVPCVIVLCGLPARGKSYIAKKLSSFLSWRRFSVKIFNAGDYRREYEGCGQTADYFSTDNLKGAQERLQLAKMAFNDLLLWLSTGGDVGLFDATNTTYKRREMLKDMCISFGIPQPLFIESIINDAALLERNYCLKLGNADYKGSERTTALEDFKKRVKMYENRYQTIGNNESDEELSYIKIFHKDTGKKFVINNVEGWLNSQVLSILQNFHTSPRRIFFTRPADTSLEAERGKGKSCLTKTGKEYAVKLAEFIQMQQCSMYDKQKAHFVPNKDLSRPLTVLSSGLTRSLETLAPTLKKISESDTRKRAFSGVDINLGSFSANSKTLVQENLEYVNAQNSVPIVCTPALNPINTGHFPLGYSHTKLMQERNDSDLDKLTYRFPGGESYQDVIHRLHPFVLELERQKEDVLCVAHTVPIRLLLAYFSHTSAETTTGKSIPLHTVLEVMPTVFGCEIVEHPLL